MENWDRWKTAMQWDNVNEAVYENHLLLIMEKDMRTCRI